jgi:hypothetical protein
LISLFNQITRKELTMAGIQYQVLRKTQISMQPLAVSSSSPVPLTGPIDTLGWVSGFLMIRIYGQLLTGTGTKMTISVLNVMVGPDDPAEVMTDNTAIATYDIDANTSNNGSTLVTVKFATGANQVIGRSVRVFLTFTSGATAPGGSATFAVDLVGRDA